MRTIKAALALTIIWTASIDGRMLEGTDIPNPLAFRMLVNTQATLGEQNFSASIETIQFQMGMDVNDASRVHDLMLESHQRISSVEQRLFARLCSSRLKDAGDKRIRDALLSYERQNNENIERAYKQLLLRLDTETERLEFSGWVSFAKRTSLVRVHDYEAIELEDLVNVLKTNCTRVE